MSDLEITLQNLKKVHKELPLLADKTPSIRGDFTLRQVGYSVLTQEDIEENKYENSDNNGLSHCIKLFSMKDQYFDAVFFSCHSFASDVFPAFYNIFSKSNVSFTYVFGENWKDTFPKFDDFIDRVENMISFIEKHNKRIESFSYETNKILS